jgi:hypothetical protein
MKRRNWQEWNEEIRKELRKRERKNKGEGKKCRSFLSFCCLPPKCAGKQQEIYFNWWVTSECIVRG